MIWLTPLVTAFLWRAGGYGLKPFGKDWRRVGVPVFLFLVSILSWKVAWYWVLLSSGLLFVATCLPITLIGDDLHEKGQLWWWIPILSMIHASTLIPLTLLSHWLIGLILAVSLGLLQWILILVCHEDKNDSWAIYEILYGFLLGIGWCVALLIG